MSAVDTRLDLEAVRALYDRYAWIVDDEIDRWPDLFTDRAVYKVVARENYDRNLPLATMLCEGRGMLLDRVAAIRETSVYMPRFRRHLISNVIVTDATAEAVHAKAYFAVFESEPDGGTMLFAAGRSFDVIAAAHGELRFAERICVFDGNLVAGSLIYPL